MKKRALRIALEVAILIGFIVVFVMVNDQITENQRKTFTPEEDSNKYAYQIESVNVEDENVVIKGWFIELKKVRNAEISISEGKELGVVLYDLQKDTDENKDDIVGIACNVEYRDRIDINDYFACEYDYSKCGFVAKIKKSELNIENGNYQIVFKPEKQGQIGILSNSYISKGNLTYINPVESSVLGDYDSEINKILGEGICLDVIPEFDMYIYQKGWEIYWIAGENYSFEDDGKTSFNFLTDTTQFNNLPKASLDKGLQWNVTTFNFEDNEIMSGKTGKFRICSQEIPRDYSVSSISTGYYSDNKWVWRTFVRPLYNYRNYKVSMGLV